MLQNFLGNLHTTKSGKSRFYNIKSGSGDRQTTVSATQKNGHGNSFQINPDDDGIMDKACAYRILKVQVRISVRELLGPNFTNYSVDNGEGLWGTLKSQCAGLPTIYKVHCIFQVLSCTTKQQMHKSWIQRIIYSVLAEFIAKYFQLWEVFYAHNGIAGIPFFKNRNLH